MNFPTFGGRTLECRRKERLTHVQGFHQKAFKEQALKLVTEKGCNLTKAARELGIPDGALLMWLKKIRLEKKCRHV